MPNEATRSNCLDVSFPTGSIKRTVLGLYQYDRGMKLRVSGIETTQVIYCQYGHSGMQETVMVIPVIEDGVIVSDIPDFILQQTNECRFYIYLDGEECGLTVMEIRMPIIPRIRPSDTEYTPEQVDTLTSLIAQLNAAIAATSQATTAANQIAQATFAVNRADGCLYMTTPD